MALVLDPTKPAAPNPTLASVRDNFAAIKAQLDALSGAGAGTFALKYSGTWYAAPFARSAVYLVMPRRQFGTMRFIIEAAHRNHNRRFNLDCNWALLLAIFYQGNVHWSGLRNFNGSVNEFTFGPLNEMSEYSSDYSVYMHGGGWYDNGTWIGNWGGGHWERRIHSQSPFNVYSASSAAIDPQR